MSYLIAERPATALVLAVKSIALSASKRQPGEPDRGALVGEGSFFRRLRDVLGDIVDRGSIDVTVYGDRALSFA